MTINFNVFILCLVIIIASSCAPPEQIPLTPVADDAKQMVITESEFFSNIKTISPEATPYFKTEQEITALFLGQLPSIGSQEQAKILVEYLKHKPTEEFYTLSFERVQEGKTVSLSLISYFPSKNMLSRVTMTDYGQDEEVWSCMSQEDLLGATIEGSFGSECYTFS